MLIFDKAYTDIKNKYIVPLIPYSVPYSKLSKVNVKEILKNKWNGVEEISGGLAFCFSQEDLFKGLLGDIELFYIRQLIHLYDTKQVSKTDMSANWDIVTNYYNAFFSASLLLRLCHRGNIFLDEQLKKSIESMVSQVLNVPIRLDSNQFFEVTNINGDSKLILKPSKKANTHEIVWIEMDKLIDEMRMLPYKNSEELLILDAIKNANNCLKITYPSKLRNRVNYQPIYGLNYLERELHAVHDNNSWVHTILGFSADMADDNQIANIMVAYTRYIDLFCYNLLTEYFNIIGKKPGFISKINELCTEKLKEHELAFSFSK